ncbi:hypothetical protein R69919_00294 [Paraburkholderia gardini]|nr:hypothetical protein R69919_00294 [Paraburkholderia gardini]
MKIGEESDGAADADGVIPLGRGNELASPGAIATGLVAAAAK